MIGFADMRGSMAMSIGAIRGYLLTADLTFKKEFGSWALNEKKFKALSKRRSEMTAEQQKAFESLVEARAKFSPLPQKMFEIRASDRWNMAQWFLTDKAAPRANKLLDIFAGDRNPKAHEPAAWRAAAGHAAGGQQERVRRNEFPGDVALGPAGRRPRHRRDRRLPDQPVDRAADPRDGRRDGAACPGDHAVKFPEPRSGTRSG